MKAINNLCLMGMNGVLADTPLKEGVNEIIVPENTVFEAKVLHIFSDISLKILLVGDRSKCDVKIVYLCNKNNNYNINIEVIHEHKNTLSNHQIKGVLTDNAKMVLNGVIRMPKDSQKCEGFLNHRGVLLSENASVKVTPELEIFADDVKCSHGSAIGALDENQLFYLLARGIDKITAQKILLKAYLSDLLPDIWDEYIDDWMAKNVSTHV